MITPPRDFVALNPLPRLREAVRAGHWRVDAVAGLTVAVFAVPQAMAYAVLAGLPPVHGLYAAVVMSVLAALWGSSPFGMATLPPNRGESRRAASANCWNSAGVAGGGVSVHSTPA